MDINAAHRSILKSRIRRERKRERLKLLVYVAVVTMGFATAAFYYKEMV